ncbi:MAG: lipopolysaccharide biosynthesis protein [Alphaproteobacteria bacterium]|nr:lipopolysaccharide biosynthesis protein [Alphaproteobacteria bacterium]
MSLGIRAVRGVLWSFAERGGHHVLRFLFYLVLARLLGPRDFGLVALALALLFLFDIVLRNWMNAPIVRLRELDPGHLDTAFWINLCMAVVLCGIAVGAADPLADLFGQPQLSSIIVWLVPAVMLKALTMVQIAYLNRTMQFRLLAIRSLLAALGGGAVGITMAFEGYGIYSLVGRELASAAIMVIVLWATSDWRPGLRVTYRRFNELFDSGKHMILNGFIRYLSRRTVTPMIGYFLGPAAAGLFNASNRIVQALSEMNEFAMGPTGLSAYSRLQDRPERLKRAFYNSVEINCLVAFPVFLGFASIAPEFTLVLLGTKWEAAIPLMQIVALVGVARSAGVSGGSLLIACGRQKWLLVENLLTTGVYLIVLYLAVQHSLAAACIVYTAQFLIRMPVGAVLVHKAIGLDLRRYVAIQLRPLLGCAAMILAIFLLRELTAPTPSIYSLALLIAFGGAVYILAMAVLAPESLKTMHRYLQGALSTNPSNPSK